MVHGLLALAVFPVGARIDLQLVSVDSAFVGVGTLLVAVPALASIVYSVFAWRERWPVHFLHLVTLIVMGASILLAALMLGGS